MKTYIKKTVEREFLDETICDRCSKPIEKESGFDAFSASIEIITGRNYPEGNFTETQSADFCEECSEYIIELLVKNGVKINKTECY